MTLTSGPTWHPSARADRGPQARPRLPRTYRDALLRPFIARPQLADLATLVAMANSDEVVRLRLLRAIRDVDA